MPYAIVPSTDLFSRQTVNLSCPPRNAFSDAGYHTASADPTSVDCKKSYLRDVRDVVGYRLMEWEVAAKEGHPAAAVQQDEVPAAAEPEPVVVRTAVNEHLINRFPNLPGSAQAFLSSLNTSQ